MATQAFDNGKKLLYLNHHIPIEVRAGMLQTAVTSTYHNLGLRVPEGKGWDMLCGGYSRLIRKLMSRQLPGDVLFKLPASVAHVIAGCPPLGMVARRARLSLLASMCKAGPNALWAALQEEQSWFQAIRDDLHWLAASEPSNWPTVEGASWPLWHRLFSTQAAWVKRQTRRLLERDFTAFQAQQSITAVVWALYKKAETMLGGRAKGGCGLGLPTLQKGVPVQRRARGTFFQASRTHRSLQSSGRWHGVPRLRDPVLGPQSTVTSLT